MQFFYMAQWFFELKHLPEKNDGTAYIAESLYLTVV